GDSGGPLSHLNNKGLQTVIGLVAKGIPLCPEIPLLPGLYTNVVENLDWIQETIAQTSSCGIRELQPQNTNPLEAGIGEFPWMTRILKQDGGLVTYGALISSNWLLTRASSVRDRSSQSLKVRVGALHIDPALDQLDDEVPIDKIIIHPQYNVGSPFSTLHNDVALLHVAKSVNMVGLPHIGPVCLPSQGETFTGQRCWVTGWTREATGTSADGTSVLQKESLLIWEPLACDRQLRKHSDTPQNFTLDRSSSLCAGGEPGKNVCVGAGAPLVCEGSDGRYVLVGIGSWWLDREDTCIRSNNPYVYSYIPNLLDFIKQNTGI
ncbi:unnamed protein product, partial [Meganyctiphanes norvegica]